MGQIKDKSFMIKKIQDFFFFGSHFPVTLQQVSI